MMKMPMSAAAAGLLRALVTRSGVRRDRILLSEFRSTDWQSLTFVGERHEISLRIPGPNAEAAAERISDGLDAAEFTIPGHVVADIVLATPAQKIGDGSIMLQLEALTIAE